MKIRDSKKIDNEIRLWNKAWHKKIYRKDIRTSFKRKYKINK
nr:hypothetical protein [Mycoplasmopsis bovis]